jgi:cation diffusion facilitator CzcD-associated flavoprotein CzcO
MVRIISILNKILRSSFCLLFHSGCDVHSHLYSFSFNLNPNWSKQLAEQAEILQYIEDTVDKFDLRKHVHASVECLGAKWDVQNKQWAVKFRDLTTNVVFTRNATILISAVGGISAPRDVCRLFFAIE